MKRYILHSCAVGVFCSTLAASASAAFIRVEPSSQTIGLTDSTTVDVVAVLDPNESLASFGMTVTIQDSGSTTSDVVDPVSATVGAGFTLTSPISISSQPFADFVDVFADATSAALVGNVILTTITFDAMSVGTSIVGLGTTILRGPTGEELSLGSPQAGSITVSQDGGSVVPVPTTPALIGLGLAGIGLARKKRRS